ncbi:MAG TPA: 50S ribosomal protein L4 [Acidimicrobiales bacterium]|nr:50S ribosomal protein L4 [Acidimicrobiales bacterium]HLN41617.1 50S ribosomal protein L4 [Acidimicrobiales bacterium]
MSIATDPTTAPGGQRRRVRPDPEHRTVERRRIDGTVIDTISLDPQIFGLVPNTAVLHQVITAQLAGARAGTQSTRTRAEVAGGGAKPFRQKGTGRARQGSIRSPQWSGGGVALGPKPRSYHQRTPKKMIRLALHSALSDRASEGKVVVVDEWSFPAPRTKDAVAALAALELGGRVLVVLGPDDGIPDRSFANLADVHAIQITELNAYDVLRNDWIVFTDATLPGETTPVPGKPAPARRARKVAAPEDGEADAGSGTAEPRAIPEAVSEVAEPAADEPAADSEGSDG